MNRLRLLCLVALLLAPLSGCYINLRTWQLCVITAEPIYCDKEALYSLMYSTPSSNWWEKDKTSDVSRIVDWIDCGGDYLGQFDAPNREEKEGADAASTSARFSEKYYEIHRCMMKKGYRFTGQCETESAKKTPACQARKSAQ